MEKENISRRIKLLFLTYFDGTYGIEPQPNTTNTYTMGVCKLEYEEKRNALIVHLRRPGLLIGKGGETINKFSEYLDCKVEIIEVSLHK